MSIVKQRHLPIREKRDGSISAFAGSLSALSAEAKDGGFIPRVRTFAQDTRSDLQSALELLSTVGSLSVVVHGPAGCFSGLAVAENSVVTGITERDSILGGDKKLRASILQAAAEFHPEAIAVVGSPVSAINNDDADAVVAEAREELGLPVFLVKADAFKSKLSANGVDLVSHAILRQIALQRAPSQSEPDVLLLSLKESERDVDSLTELLTEIGVKFLTFPRYSKPREWERVSHAHVAIAIDPSDADFAGRVLQNEFGVRYVDGVLPIGIAGTAAWLSGLAEVLGKQAEAQALAEKHRAALDDWKHAFGRHQGARVYISAPPGLALALVGLLNELQLGLAGLTLTYAESRHQAKLAELAREYPDLPILVGEGQAFEEANLLRKVGASLYVGLESSVSHVLRLGIPVLDLAGLPIYGFGGALRFAESAFRRLENAALAQFLSEGQESYSAQWFAKSTHWFIKHEVK